MCGEQSTSDWVNYYFIVPSKLYASHSDRTSKDVFGLSYWP